MLINDHTDSSLSPSVLPFHVIGTVSIRLWSWHKSKTLKMLCLFSHCYFCLLPRMARTSVYWMSRGLLRSCSRSTSNTTTSPVSYGSWTCVSIVCLCNVCTHAACVAVLEKDCHPDGSSWTKSLSYVFCALLVSVIGMLHNGYPITCTGKEAGVRWQSNTVQGCGTAEVVALELIVYGPCEGISCTEKSCLV